MAGFIPKHSGYEQLKSYQKANGLFVSAGLLLAGPANPGIGTRLFAGGRFTRTDDTRSTGSARRSAAACG